MCNTLRIVGCLMELAPMRYTPAGVPMVGFVLGHESRQVENGIERSVLCELQGVALGDIAKTLSSAVAGMEMEATGFLAAKNQRSKMPVLHLTNIKFVEGNEHGL
ncbi:MAG TPA: primosomal replication protein N [Denitromonas sp.]|uniref:primosomal replication protein N n=1 Tax=Denitromonas sp. TaxID=2734609 RepID=UPI002C13ACBC|nr:primosomal replication protein N [Denitromonas sp.]HQV15448.1 primosomal replication protein N [Denitromonas sp.]